MGNRIDNRARGNAAQLLEKYKTLARDAQMQGDRVNTEYYLQFADHYFRVLAEQRGRAEEQNPRRGREDSFDGDFDDYGDEGDLVRADEQNGRDGYREERGGRDGQDRDGQERGGQSRDDRSPREARSNRQPRDDRGNRDDFQRDGAQRDDRPQRRVSRDQARENQGTDDRDQDRSRDGERPLAVTPANDYEGVEAAEPRRRGRPRKVQAEGAEPAPTFDAAILPPSLGITPSGDSGDEGEVAEKPRRRRRAAGDEVSQAS
ncbi:DUF4167 domain-containing protein [Sphingomonas sp. EC-HK361]|uniref:DUF4167 domain-containing protein n=1 Tax=Sphingomonas sp. EC-HK361 TaxID=2038397 RepID=UPI001F2198EA|nr:DUF4167 domain-containing protein [Sphingomonas sp. EC-HK361]